MIAIDLTEQKKILLDILIKIDKYCRDNNIRYSLGGGTLLGAIRHKGFIPWDDDIDIMMPRSDYNRFIIGFQKYDKNLDIESFEINKKWYFPYAKVYNNNTIQIEPNCRWNTGIFIDVFPIDGLPSDKKERKHIIKKTYFWMINLYHKRIIYKQLSIKSILIKLKNLFLSTTFLNSKIQKSLIKYSFETSPYAGAICGRYGEKECYERSMFESYTETLFENHYFMIIKDFHLYLSQHYGENYMKIPPKEKQKTTHTESAFWINNSNKKNL